MLCTLIPLRQIIFSLCFAEKVGNRLKCLYISRNGGSRDCLVRGCTALYVAISSFIQHWLEINRAKIRRKKIELFFFLVHRLMPTTLRVGVIFFFAKIDKYKFFKSVSLRTARIKRCDKNFQINRTYWKREVCGSDWTERNGYRKT